MEFSCYDIKELVFDMNLRENIGLVVKSLRVHCLGTADRNKSGQTTQDAAKQQQSQRQLQGCPFTASTLVLSCTIQVMTSTSPVPTHHTQVFGIYCIENPEKRV